jgi:tetratricopeptide (TPR) repeat protein
MAQKKPKSTPAIDSLERIVAVDSNDAVLHYDLATAYWAVKRYDDAERELHEAVALAPQYAEAYLALSAIPVTRGAKYWRKFEKEHGKAAVEQAFESADRLYRKALLINPLVQSGILGKVPEKSEVRDGIYIFSAWWLQPMARSINALRNARYQKALDLLQGLLDDHKAGADGLHLPEEVLWYHGIAAAALGRYDDAIHDFAILTGRAIADEQANPLTAVPLKANDYRYVLATMLYLAGRSHQAAPTFRRALEFDIGLYPAHVQLARMFEAEQRWDEAIMERRAAVNANPDDASLLTDLGRTLLRAGKLEEAAEALAQAMAANPRDPYSPHLAGIVALRLDRKEAARDAFKRFLALAPSRFATQIAEVRGQMQLLETR